VLRREVAEILATRMRDPRISQWVSVTDVVVTRDLAVARIFVSILAPEADRKATLKLLEHAAPFVRHELAPRLDLRELPELRFHLDTSLERGSRVNELLQRIERGETIEDDELQ
jgi:ribosome-binding factor A